MQWQASTSGAGWLSLSLSSGSVQPGGVPQNIQVTIDTNNRSLQAGSNSASITIHSNGGDVTIPVTLTLLSGNTPTPTPSQPPTPTSIPPTPTPTPSPTPSPTVLPTTWSVSPTNLSTNSCSGSSTWSCTVTLSEGAGSPGNIKWSASDSLGSASFSPGSGTLSPGASTQITISSIPCQNDSFTFTDSAGVASPISALWTCVIQPPRGTASLGSCSYTAGSGWSCPVTIAASGNNQVSWPWNSSSSGVSGISITPSSGSLSPGQSTTATVTIPDMLCPASATITITGPADTIPLNWSCAAPTLMVTVNTPTCPGDSTNGWTCTVTLSLASGDQGQLTWTSSVSSNLPGASLSPSSGTLSAGQQTPVTISIPANDCTDGTFYFSGSDGSNASVTWTCPQA